MSLSVFFGAVLAAGLGAKVAIIAFLLLIQWPVQKATEYLVRHEFLQHEAATLIDIAVPMVGLFLLTNFVNALPEPEKRCGRKPRVD